MSTENIVQLLITERDRLNRAIDALQSATARRGRPPGSGSKAAPGRKRGRRGMSAAARKAQSARMKAYWAARRKQKG
jgi:hypothetical protein